MCAACIEYTKDRLNADEFRSALREMTVEDQEHARLVEELIRTYAGQPEELKRQLKLLSATRK